MSEATLYKIFQQSVEAKMNAGDSLFPEILNAAERIVECLLNGGKLLICGNGTSAALAQIFTSKLVNQFERERPCLPAITLGCDPTVFTSIANERNFNDVLAREIKAIGSEGDLLIVLTASGKSSNLIQAIQAAHEKNMSIISLNGSDGGHLFSLLDVTDREIRVPSESRARIHEIHLLIIFCLCQLIDEQLFGLLENE
ncbi:MAG: D-sedoheptulose 7-phosphate isomerase [Cellvibrionaceae bacterium]|jgi:D-sedoheptulose 7-phosphate isomerase